MKLRPFIFLLITALGLLPGCRNESPKTPKNGADPALATLNALIEQNPENDSLYYLRADRYYQLEGYDEALNDIGTALRLDSMQPMYYHMMADVLLDYARPNDSRRAIEVLKTAAGKFPDRIPTLLKLSEFQLIVRRHGDALGTLDRILQRDPQNAEAIFMSGRVFLDKGDTTKAIVALQKSVQLDAGILDAWVFLGRIFDERNSPLAEQYYNNALRLDSTNLEVLEYKGAFFKRRGAFDKAFAVYRDIVQRNPDYSNAYFDMGMIYLELDSLGKAYDNFDIAVKTDPLFVKAYYFRGVAAEARGDLTAALADYTQANKMSPNYQEAREARERLEKQQK